MMVLLWCYNGVLWRYWLDDWLRVFQPRIPTTATRFRTNAASVRLSAVLLRSAAQNQRSSSQVAVRVGTCSDPNHLRMLTHADNKTKPIAHADAREALEALMS